MAYIVLLKGPSSLTPTSRNFYNLDNTVGAGGVNKIDDVRAVHSAGQHCDRSDGPGF